MKIRKNKIFIFLNLCCFYLVFFVSSTQANPAVLDIKKLLEENLNKNNEIKSVDIESLGLDNLEKKNSNQNVYNVDKNPNLLSNNNSSSQSEKKDFSSSSINNSTTKNIPIAKTTSLDFSKVNESNLNVSKNKKTLSSKPNKLTKNSKRKDVKKSPLRLKLEKDEAIINNKKIDEEKEKKYQNLRALYLSDLLESEDNIDEDLINSDKILPTKKALAPFGIDELPPLPILNRNRSPDNYHIPYVYTPKEYIDIMFSAISMGSVSYFNEAFKYVLNPNITNDQGDTILTYAIFLKKYAVMASVLAKGADPNLPNMLGHLPVSIAIELNDFVALEMLAKNNADLKYRDAYGRNFIMHASRVGFLPAVDLLVKAGVDINEMDDDGFTALSIAYKNKKELIVQYLLKNGAKTWIEKPYNPEQKSFIKNLKDRWK